MEGGPIRLIVDFLRVWYSREELQSRLGSLDDAARMERVHVESAIEQIDREPENLRVRVLLSDIDELTEHSPKQDVIETIEELRTAIGTADVRLIVNLTRQLYDKGMFAAALEAIGIAIDLVPDNALAHAERVYVLWALQRHEEALAVAERAIELAPTNLDWRAER